MNDTYRMLQKHPVNPPFLFFLCEVPQLVCQHNGTLRKEESQKLCFQERVGKKGGVVQKKSNPIVYLSNPISQVFA